MSTIVTGSSAILESLHALMAFPDKQSAANIATPLIHRCRTLAPCFNLEPSMTTMPPAAVQNTG
jgi:hypothetical protein